MIWNLHMLWVMKFALLNCLIAKEVKGKKVMFLAIEEVLEIVKLLLLGCSLVDVKL